MVTEEESGGRRWGKITPPQAGTMARPGCDATLHQGDLQSENNVHGMDLRKPCDSYDRSTHNANATSDVTPGQLGRGKRMKIPKLDILESLPTSKHVDRPKNTGRSKSLGREKVWPNQGLDGQTEHPI